jgi:hypothetical protein
MRMNSRRTKDIYRSNSIGCGIIAYLMPRPDGCRAVTQRSALFGLRELQRKSVRRAVRPLDRTTLIF